MRIRSTFRGLAALALTVALVVLAFAMNIGNEPSSVAAASASISTSNFSFTPAHVTISIGDTINWTNLSGHTATADDGSFDSSGPTFSYTYTQAGTFLFHCFFHRGIGMTGEVVVVRTSLTATPAVTPTPTTAPAATPTPTSLPTATPIPVPTAIGSNRQYVVVGARNGSFN